MCVLCVYVFVMSDDYLKKDTVLKERNFLKSIVECRSVWRSIQHNVFVIFNQLDIWSVLYQTYMI